MPDEIRRKSPDEPFRGPSFWIDAEGGKIFRGAVELGDRRRAMENLFAIAIRAARKDRRLWSTIVNKPENLELVRK